MNKQFLLLVLVMSTTVFVGWSTIRIYKSYVMTRDCTGYLKQAADANTVPIAKERLQKALNYIEKNELTNGVTTIIFNVPKNDIGFWYRNIKASLEELNTVSDESTSLEKSNMLIKLRETLLDSGGDSTEITHPPGISIFPHNLLYALIGWISALDVLISIVWLIFKLDNF